MDRGPFFLIVLEISFLAITCANSRTQYDGSSLSVLQKRSVSNHECLPLQVSTNRQLHEFGRTFAELSSGLDKIPNNFTGDVILFVGNTGVGKSSLVHILAGEGANFVARENGEDSGDFYIEDTLGKFVKNSTIDSTTTYPEAVVDAATGAVLFDTPGFRDTRSAVHEIVATYGLRKVAEVSQRIKIALLVNYNSLTPSGPRDDFTNTLESFFNLFNNTHKFQDSTHLIVTKTENRFIVRRGKIIPVSAATHIKGIVQFLKGVSQTLENRKGKHGDGNFIRNAQALIGSLEDNIALFMKPDISGPISESHSLQQSLQSIREMLLVDDGYVRVEVGDFGFAISDSAKVYIRNLYDLMNSHIEEVSKSFAIAFEKFITSKSHSFDNIGTIRSNLKNTAQQVKILIHTTNTSATPVEYVDAIMNLTASVKIEFCSKHVLDEIRQLAGYLDGLKKITDHFYYTPSKWSESLYPLERLVQNELMFYDMLDSLYNKITDYSVMFSDPTVKALKLGESTFERVEEVKHFIQHLGLTQYTSLQITPGKIMQISSFMRHVFGRQEITCNKSQKTLVILDSILKTSILDVQQLATCQHLITTVVLIATRKLYIDANINVDLLEGRNLVVIAPEWHIMGRFTMSVDGKSVNDKSWGRAPPGREGLDGMPGHSAGQFVGVALRYFNSNLLKISARGGNGGPGEDGGNGQNGKDGRDGSSRSRIDDTSSIYLVYNSFKTKYLIKAEYGTDGGDAGRGGMGGTAGSAGSIKMHSLSKHSPDRSTHHVQPGTKGRDGENGRPGRGGLRGCDVIEEEIERRILFFPVSTKRESSFLHCRRRNFDGTLLPRSKPSIVMVKLIAVPPPPTICVLYEPVKRHFEVFDDIISHSTAVEFRKAFHKEFGC